MLEITLTLLALVIIMWIWWRKRKLGLFKRLNIPGPTPTFFFGNSSEIAHKGETRCFKEWIKKYGKVFGVYHGLRPTLVVMDLDMINAIMMMNFKNYLNRSLVPDVGTLAEKLRKYSVFFVKDKAWKRLRRIMTPMFSSLKVKMVMPIFQQTVEELVVAVERESTKQRYFDIHGLYQKFTVDSIARTSLGIHTRAQNDPDDPLYKCLPFLAIETPGYIKILAFSFPELWSVLSVIRRITLRWQTTGKRRNQVDQLVEAAVRVRMENPENRRKDLLQLLIDGRKMEDFETKTDLITDKEGDKTTSKNVEKLSKEEIVQNAITALFAGNETTGIALGCITYLLAHNQDIQDEVREEIRSVVSENKEISYEAIQSMHSLENVIYESLRIYPPSPTGLTRQGIEDMELQGKKIPKETTIHIPIHIIHHDPELWDDPEKFNPLRWSSEGKAALHPMIFQSFGAGPRNCPGKRFAYIEMKLALATLLLKYKFLPAPGSQQGNLQFYKHFGIILPKNGIMVEAQKI